MPHVRITIKGQSTIPILEFCGGGGGGGVETPNDIKKKAALSNVPNRVCQL